MDTDHSWPDALPGEIPIFPLAGALLLPGGRLPLNIFEPRYLAMTEDALARGRLLGMVLPDPAGPRPGGRSTIYRIGCLGRIASFSETPDGRYMITLLGLSRFRVVSELPDSPRGYRRVRVDHTPFAADREETPEGAVDRAALLAALRPYFPGAPHRGGLALDRGHPARGAGDHPLHDLPLRRAGAAGAAGGGGPAGAGVDAGGAAADGQRRPYRGHGPSELGPSRPELPRLRAAPVRRPGRHS